MADRFEPPRSILAVAALAVLACATGCTYLRARGRDALDLVDVGFTFSTKPQFGIYGNCPFIAPGGYSKVDGYYAGIGGGKFGVMEHHQDAAALLVWGREDVGWKDAESDEDDGSGTRTVGPLGVSTDAEGNPAYKPQCAHYLHLGFIGVTGNLNYREWPDFLLGWLGIDTCDDDKRVVERASREQKLVDISARLSRPHRGLQLVARTNKHSYAMDEPIALDVHLVNRTGRSRLAGEKPRDLSVYFEPFARTPSGQPAEWLFKFYVFEVYSDRQRYKSPRFEVPLQERRSYYHYAKLPANAFVGRRFVFPPAREQGWLEPGDYFFLVAYEVDDDYPYLVINPQLTAAQAELLGPDVAYTRLWTGRLYSNLVTFRIERKRFLGLF